MSKGTMKIAIVGSEEAFWSPAWRTRVVKRIRDILRPFELVNSTDHASITLVSGACPKGGVDIWAEIVADTLDVPKKIYPPTKPTWYYYRKRNIQIAEDCDVLYCFDPKWRGSKTGGQWTYRYAKNELGKRVYLELIE